VMTRGFHGIGLEDIAQAAGVSRQAIYKSHFTSKADLLLELVQHVHVAENLAELTRPVFEAQSGLAMLEETIRAIVKIETKLHDLAVVLSTTALTDSDAAAAWRDRMEVKRGALRAALLRVEAEGRFNSAWKLEEAVDVLMALVSVDTYQQLVVERGWKEGALIRRAWELCQSSFVVPPKRRKARSKGAR
jgi:AcrR family transcriptional regulator